MDSVRVSGWWSTGHTFRIVNLTRERFNLGHFHDPLYAFCFHRHTFLTTVDGRNLAPVKRFGIHRCSKPPPSNPPALTLRALYVWHNTDLSKTSFWCEHIPECYNIKARGSKGEEINSILHSFEAGVKWCKVSSINRLNIHTWGGCACTRSYITSHKKCLKHSC